jgi:hypothetical protein
MDESFLDARDGQFLKMAAWLTETNAAKPYFSHQEVLAD